MTPDVFLSGLDALRVPMWVATPGGVGGGEFTRPAGWQAVSMDDNPDRLHGWRPGCAIGGNMGGQVAVVDCDPQHPKNRRANIAEDMRATLDGIGVRLYAEVATPGGGRHFYVAGSEDVPSTSALVGWPGVDVISFGRNAFLPGTQRPKYHGRGYSIVSDDLATLVEGDDDSAEALAGWVSELQAPVTPAAQVSPAWSGAALDRRQTAYLDKAVEATYERLAGMSPDSGRNKALYTAAMKFGSLIAGAGLDEKAAVKRLVAAAKKNGLWAEDGYRSVDASVASGLKNGKKAPKTVPAPRPMVDPIVLIRGIVTTTTEEPAEVRLKKAGAEAHTRVEAGRLRMSAAAKALYSAALEAGVDDDVAVRVIQDALALAS